MGFPLGKVGNEQDERDDDEEEVIGLQFITDELKVSCPIF
jgi:hypothetical protein